MDKQQIKAVADFSTATEVKETIVIAGRARSLTWYFVARTPYRWLLSGADMYVSYIFIHIC